MHFYVSVQNGLMRLCVWRAGLRTQGNLYLKRINKVVWHESGQSFNQYLFLPQVKVLHNQLLLFHNAIAAYYAGNQQQLEQTLKQFHIKLKMPGGDNPSWLEEH